MPELPRILRWLFPQRQQGLSRADLEDMDVAVEYPLTLFDLEKFEVKDGELVATTGTIEEGQITPIAGKHLEGSDRTTKRLLMTRVAASFENEKPGLIKAAKATCLLFVKITDAQNRVDWEFATAFFVGKNTLLTAGHAALDSRDTKTERYIFLPGTRYLDMDNVQTLTPYAIRCTVLDTIYKSTDPSRDIAILSSGSFETQSYVTLAADRIPNEVTVDIVGYPGRKSTKWLRDKHQGLRSLVDAEKSGEIFLPTGHLAVTRGVVLENTDGNMTSYKISTCPGLSGSCVVYNGKVYGIKLTFEC